jgi:hypothetical protein
MFQFGLNQHLFSKLGPLFVFSISVVKLINQSFDLCDRPTFKMNICYDVAIAQINYPTFKHNTQYSIEQARGRSHEEDSSQIFMLDDMQFRRGFGRYLG